MGLEVPVLDPERCTLCGACRTICRYKAIAQFASRLTIFTDMCHGCGGCFAVCPSQALTPAAVNSARLEQGTVLEGRGRFLMGRSRIGEAMTPPLLRALRKKLDLMLTAIPADAIIDSPPGVSCPAMTVGLDADAVLLVAEPTPFGFHDFRLAHQAFRQIGKPVAVIMNRAAMPGNAEGDGVLRAYIYDSIRRAGRFQDVKSSTRLEWNTDMEENEWIAEQVDIVAVSGIHPLFIMARTEEPSEESST